MHLTLQRSLFALFLVSLILGCATTAPQAQKPIVPIGEMLVNNIDISHVNNARQIEPRISQLITESNYNKKNKAKLIDNISTTSELVLALAQGNKLQSSISNRAISTPDETDTLVLVGVRLFPSNGYALVNELLLDHRLDEDSIKLGAIAAGLDEIRFYPPTAGVSQGYAITPLFNSASITFYQQSADSSADVKYRKLNSEQWLNAFPLSWEPTQKALSGSIVRLEPDTEYQVTATLRLDDEEIEQYDLTFITRSNTPPINPNLIFKLSEIYTGGQLNIEALGIEGTEDGWAKIIGDNNTPIITTENDVAAIEIGDNSYIYFENVVVQGGGRHGIRSNRAHHLWFKGCDISKWGRTIAYLDQGIGHTASGDEINYDSGIFLMDSGVVVVEDCDIHSPRPYANNWNYGHPKGPNAMLILANHPNANYSGQYVIRNNRFYGTDSHRFNDVIESRSNGRAWGGFYHNSAIHDNYLAYSNDDIIELDGGQNNVLFYNNEIEQGYCGVSAIPNMHGPSYIFNNYIHNLGDDRQSTWAAVKLGGLMSAPAGVTHIFNNIILTKNNGISKAGFNGDNTYMAVIQNNFMTQQAYWTNNGYGIYDEARYPESKFVNNYSYNFSTQQSEIYADVTAPFFAPLLLNDKYAESIKHAGGTLIIELPAEYLIPNFSTNSPSGTTIGLITSDQKNE